MIVSRLKRRTGEILSIQADLYHCNNTLKSSSFRCKISL